MQYVLNRLAITGKINERTPLCVISEIAEAHRISIDHSKIGSSSYLRIVLDNISKTPLARISYPFNTTCRQIVIKYLGIRDPENWSDIDLIDTLDYWNTTNSLINTCATTYISVVGDPTHLYPQSLNVCFLYKICLKRSINVPFDITIDQLSALAKFCSMNSGHLCNILNTFLSRASDNQILPIMAALPKELLSTHKIKQPNPKNVSHVDISVTIDRLGVSQINANRLVPRNAEEAIIIAAVSHKCNLLYTADPLLEYNVLRKTRREDYIPLDRISHKLYLDNPALFNLNFFFDPRLPKDLYSVDQLRNLCRFEGLYVSRDDNETGTVSVRSSLYEQLEVAYLSETFHIGILPCNVNSITPILRKNIKPGKGNRYVTFGIRSDHAQTIHLKELTYMFKSNQEFRNVIPDINGGPRDELFSKSQIMKLKNICNSGFLHFEQSRSLLSELLVIDTINNSGSNQMRSFANLYSRSNDILKESIRTAIIHLFELSMYMRNWDGSPGKYPIETTPSIDNQNEIDVRVTDKLAVFENHIRSMEQFGESFLDLPIYKHMGGEFIVSRELYNGYTLRDRISIVKENNTDNVSACIRLTSNYFAASCIVYSRAIRMPDLFDINRLSNIT